MLLKKNKYLVFFVILFVLLIFSFFLNRSKTEEPLTREDFPPESYVVVEESKDATVENFPDIPQYPVSEIVNSRYYTEEGGEGYSLELSTNDPVLDVIEWYKEVLDERDWYFIFQSEITDEPDYFLIEYKKLDIQLDVTAVTQEEGTTRVIITHHEHMGEYGPAVKYE